MCTVRTLVFETLNQLVETLDLDLMHQISH